MAIYKSYDAFGGAAPAAAAAAGHHFMDREEKRSEEETGKGSGVRKEGRGSDGAHRR